MHILCFYFQELCNVDLSVGTVIVRSTHTEEEISDKRDGRRSETEMGKCHVDRVFNKSEIGVSITKKIINHQRIFQIDHAGN
jgi:hypothetical protein